jgi:hypothetical protein
MISACTFGVTIAIWQTMRATAGQYGHVGVVNTFTLTSL